MYMETVLAWKQKASEAQFWYNEMLYLKSTSPVSGIQSLLAMLVNKQNKKQIICLCIPEVRGLQRYMPKLTSGLRTCQRKLYRTVNTALKKSLCQVSRTFEHVILILWAIYKPLAKTSVFIRYFNACTTGPPSDRAAADRRDLRFPIPSYMCFSDTSSHFSAMVSLSSLEKDDGAKTYGRVW